MTEKLLEPTYSLSRTENFAQPSDNSGCLWDSKTCRPTNLITLTEDLQKISLIVLPTRNCHLEMPLAKKYTQLGDRSSLSPPHPQQRPNRQTNKQTRITTPQQLKERRRRNALDARNSKNHTSQVCRLFLSDDFLEPSSPVGGNLFIHYLLM
jgi:hypothetical protein